MNENNLCNNMRLLRESKGYTQKDLSEQLNVLKQSYSNYETGHRIPPVDFLVQFSKFFHVPLDILICGTVDAEGRALSGSLDRDTAALLADYQALSPWDQHEIRVLIKTKLKRPAGQ